MKIAKLLLKSVTILGLLGGTSSFAQTNVVYSVNMVGFQKIAIEPGDIASSASPFIQGGTNNLDNMIGDQLDASTVVWTFNGLTWEQNQNFGGQWFNLDQGAASDDDLIPGTSFLIQNNTGSTQEVVIVGEVVPSMTTTNIIPAGLTPISNPYSSDLDLNATASVTLVAAMNAGDTIWTYDSVNNVWEDNQAFGGTLFNLQDGGPTPAIPSGQGFLYINTGSQITWIQPPLY